MGRGSSFGSRKLPYIFAGMFGFAVYLASFQAVCSIITWYSLTIHSGTSRLSAFPSYKANFQTSPTLCTNVEVEAQPCLTQPPTTD
jgi:hypothetical protein